MEVECKSLSKNSRAIVNMTIDKNKAHLSENFMESKQNWGGGDTGGIIFGIRGGIFLGSISKWHFF